MMPNRSMIGVAISVMAILAITVAIQQRQIADLKATASTYQNIAWSDAEVISWLASGQAKITKDQQKQIMVACYTIRRGLTDRGFKPRTLEDGIARTQPHGSLDHNAGER